MRICTHCQPVCYKTVGLRSPAVKSNQITAVNHNESKMNWTRYKINQLNIINYDPIGHSAAMASLSQFYEIQILLNQTKISATPIAV